MREYRLTRDHVLFDLPSVEGWAYVAWSKEANPWGGIERASVGYVAQELDRLDEMK